MRALWARSACGMMYRAGYRFETKLIRYHPNVKSGVATMTVSAAAMMKKPSVAFHDHRALRPVHSGNHQRAAKLGVDIPL